jgi:hypothetical protein
MGLDAVGVGFVQETLGCSVLCFYYVADPIGHCVDHHNRLSDSILF